MHQSHLYKPQSIIKEGEVHTFFPKYTHFCSQTFYFTYFSLENILLHLIVAWYSPVTPLALIDLFLFCIYFTSRRLKLTPQCQGQLINHNSFLVHDEYLVEFFYSTMDTFLTKLKNYICWSKLCLYGAYMAASRILVSTCCINLLKLV